MSGNLTNQRIRQTFGRLLQVANGNEGIDDTLRSVLDGKGDATPLQLSNAAVKVDGPLDITGPATALTPALGTATAQVQTGAGVLAEVTAGATRMTVTQTGTGAVARTVQEKSSDLISAADYGGASRATAIQSVTTMAALRDFPTQGLAAGHTINLAGYFAAADGGDGAFTWAPSNSQTDDGGLIIKPTAVSGAGRWVRVVFFGRLSALMFGADPTGNTSSTTAIQALLDSWRQRAWNTASTAGGGGAVADRYRYFFDIPAGIYKISNLVMSDPFGTTNSQRGYVTIQGVPGSTILVCTAATETALLLKCGNIKVSGITIDADRVSRDKTTGSGEGLRIDSTSRNTAPTTASLFNVTLENIRVVNQPGDAFLAYNVELHTWRNCSASSCGGRGFAAVNGGLLTGGISMLTENCVAANCDGIGWDISCSHSTHINAQSLKNGGDPAMRFTGRNATLIAPDAEHDNALGPTNNFIGIALSGGGTILNPIVYGFRTAGIRISDYSRVENAYLTNEDFPYAMSNGVEMTSGSSARGCYISIRPTTNVGASFVPTTCPPTCEYVLGSSGYHTVGNPTFALAASATPTRNGECVLEHTSDTSLTLKLRGSDGTVRSVALTIA